MINTQFYPPFRGTFFQAKRFESNHQRLIDSKTADLLIETIRKDSHGISMLSSIGMFWTGTLVAYPPPGQPFQDSLSSRHQTDNFIMNTRPFRNIKNAALVLDAYGIERQGEYLRLCPDAVDVIFSFPQMDGTFGMHENTGVPMFSGGPRRHIWRSHRGGIFPLVRSFSPEGTEDVFLNMSMTDCLGILLLPVEDPAPQKPEGNVIPFPRKF